MLPQHDNRSGNSARGCCGHALDEGPDLCVLGESSVKWPDYDDEKVHGQKHAQSGSTCSDHSGDKIADEGNRDHHRAGGYHGDGHGVEKLCFRQPVMFLDYSSMQKWNDGQATAKHK